MEEEYNAAFAPIIWAYVKGYKGINNGENDSFKRSKRPIGIIKKMDRSSAHPKFLKIIIIFVYVNRNGVEKQMIM